MARRISDSGGDQFMPEYWPANRLIGELENIKVEAENIIGKLKAGQIEGVFAEAVIGQLTNEQIEEIAAAKVSGQLTNAQIESLEAAKLLGQIKEVQIAEGAITAKKIAANAITAEKILAESITALKIAAGAVTAAKLAAGSVTAEKIAVEKLSAISANLGHVTAGVIEGVEISALKSFILHLKEEESLGATLKWVNEASEEKLKVAGFATKKEVAMIIGSETKKNQSKFIISNSEEEKGEKTYLQAQAGGQNRTIIDGNSRSSFLQLASAISPSVRRVMFGKGALIFRTGSQVSEAAIVLHGLEAAPTAVFCMNFTAPSAPFVAAFNAFSFTAESFLVNCLRPGTAGESEISFMWIALL